MSERRMMAVNELLYGRAKESLVALFSDCSVSKDECISNLETLKQEIDILLESLED